MRVEPIVYQRISPMDQPRYVVPATCYVRNNGHTHSIEGFSMNGLDTLIYLILSGCALAVILMLWLLRDGDK